MKRSQRRLPICQPSLDTSIARDASRCLALLQASNYPIVHLLLLILQLEWTSAAACSLCGLHGGTVDRSRVLEPGVLPSDWAGFVKTCGDAEDLAQFLTTTSSSPSENNGQDDQDDDLCTWIQSISSLCGCQMATPNPCRLCSHQDDDASLTNADAIVPTHLLPAAIHLPSDEMDITCTLLDAFLASHTETDAICQETKMQSEELEQLCGCSASFTDAASQNSIINNTITTNPPESTTSSSNPNCRLHCPLSEMAYRDKDITHMIAAVIDLPTEFVQRNLTIRCSDFDKLFPIVAAAAPRQVMDKVCQKESSILTPLSGICGCPSPSSPTKYCAAQLQCTKYNHGMLPFPDQFWPGFDLVYDAWDWNPQAGDARGKLQITCQEFVNLMTQYPVSETEW